MLRGERGHLPQDYQAVRRERSQHQYTEPRQRRNKEKNHENSQVQTKQRRNKIQHRTRSRMQSKLLSTPAAISYQHPSEAPQTGAWPAINKEFRIVNEF